MKRTLFPLFSVVAIVAWCMQGFAAVQSIPPSAKLSVDGQNNGVTITAPAILTVDGTGGFANIGNTGGVSVATNAINQGNVVFSVNSTVSGSMGASTNTLAEIDAETPGTTVTFNGTVSSVLMKVGGTADFDSATLGAAGNKAAIDFTAVGAIINVAANTSVTGALTNNAAGAQGGTLNLDGAAAGVDQWTGQVGTSNAGLKSINLVGNAITSQITGAVSTYAFNLGNSTLNIIGTLAVSNGAGGAINTDLQSSSIYGHIVDTGVVSVTNGLTIDPTVTGAIGVGTRFNIIAATGGTPTGITPIVISQTTGYTFTALPTSANGLVTIVTSGIPAAGGAVIVAPPVVLTLITLPTLDPIASGVVAGISSLTDPVALAQANAQLGPSAPSLAAPQVTFQGAREFQNLWESHLEMCSQAGSADEESCKGTNPSNGVWVKGFGYFGSQDARPEYNYAGYDATIFGTMVAYVVPIIDENTRAGVGLGYSHTTIDGRTYETNSNTDFDTFQPTVYIGHEQGPWFVHGSESFGYNQYSAQRGIAIAGTDYVAAKSDYSGEDYTTYVNGGYNFSAPAKFTVTPIASLQYTRVNMDSYTEKDAGDLDLHVKPQGYDFLESGLGAKVERDFSVRNWQLVPEVHLEWLHDFLNPTMGQTAQYTVGSPSFYTSGVKTDPDTLHAGTSLSLLSCTCSKTKLSLEVGYDFYWRNDGYTANQVTMRVTGRF